jgi:hypothetical protein
MVRRAALSVLFALYSSSFGCSADVAVHSPTDEEPTFAAEDDGDDVGERNDALTYDAPAGWRSLASSTTVGFGQRRWSSSIWTGSKMIVFGGQTIGTNSVYSNQGAAYDPVTNTWSMLPASPLSGRTEHVAVWSGTRMYVWGGRNETYLRMTSGARYRPDTGVWSRITSSPHTLGCTPQGVWSKTTSELIVFGCVQRSGVNVPSGMAYNASAKTWREIAAFPLAPRMWEALVWAGNRMVVFGGATPDQSHRLADGAEYDPVTDSWRVLPASPLGRRKPGTALVADGSKLVVWGGEQEVDTSYGPFMDVKTDGAIYDTATRTWTTIPASTASLARRVFFSATWGGGRLSIFGGQYFGTTLSDPNDAVYPDTGMIYDPAARTWSNTESGPIRRNDTVAFWTGSDSLIWGGNYIPPPEGQQTIYMNGAFYRP